MTRFHHFVLGLIAFATLLTGCKDDDANVPKMTKAKHTVVVYIAAENNLRESLTKDINEMLEGARRLDDSCRTVIFIDDYEKPRIYTVDNTTQYTDFDMLAPDYEFPEELNSCSKDGLRTVMQYIRSNYLSDSYGLVMCSHGTGWLPTTFATSEAAARAGVRRSFGVDNDGKGTYSQMSIADLADVLATFPHLDFIMFDACYMQSVEVAYALRKCADHIIATPAETPSNGAPYDDILPLLFERPADYTKVIQIYHDEYIDWRSDYHDCGVVFSDIKTSELDNLYSVTRRMFQAHQSEWNTASKTGVTRYLELPKSVMPVTWNYNITFYDIKSLMRAVLTDDEYSEWTVAADAAIGAYCLAPYVYSAELIPTYPIYDNSCGVAMSLPPSLEESLPGTMVIEAYEALGWKME